MSNAMDEPSDVRRCSGNPGDGPGQPGQMQPGDCFNLNNEVIIYSDGRKEVRIRRRVDSYSPIRQPHGCICPPTSEQTCMNPLCPRRRPTQ